MKFPNTYLFLRKNKFTCGDYSLVPIRYEDRIDIMEWRNEQIYHLRQKKLLTVEQQDQYYQNIVNEIFQQQQPDNILFSYLKNGKCIGYGGLVHINWIDKNAEISFIMDTKLEEKEFELHWGIYLNLLEEVAFKELGLHKIYTYAFDLRPCLYAAVEKAGFIKEAVLKEHCFFDGVFKDVIIHSKYKNMVSIRPVDLSDLDFTFFLSNDSLIRENSYDTSFIPYNSHKGWFSKKINDNDAFYYIGEFNRQSAVFLRIDIGFEENIIGIAISEKFRGKGLAVPFLNLISQEFIREKRKKVTAYIKEGNLPSIKSFERAGYVLDGSCVVNNEKSLRYIYEK